MTFSGAFVSIVVVMCFDFHRCQMKDALLQSSVLEGRALVRSFCKKIKGEEPVEVVDGPRGAHELQ